MLFRSRVRKSLSSAHATTGLDSSPQDEGYNPRLDSRPAWVFMLINSLRGLQRTCTNVYRKPLISPRARIHLALRHFVSKFTSISPQSLPICRNLQVHLNPNNLGRFASASILQRQMRQVRRIPLFLLLLFVRTPRPADHRAPISPFLFAPRSPARAYGVIWRCSQWRVPRSLAVVFGDSPCFRARLHPNDCIFSQLIARKKLEGFCVQRDPARKQVAGARPLCG